MQKYKDFQPTGLDSKGLNADEYEIAEFFVVCSQNRDSDSLERSNFDSILKHLGGESSQVQVHRFNHWACGWFEVVLAHPDLELQIQDIENQLSNYPIFDESHWSDLQFEEACAYWTDSPLWSRVDICREAGISIFTARQADLPDSGKLYEYLTRN